ncbi:LOW QUALITY PROTEIN: calpain-9 [Gadus macrocephalus]|uniref:LOW QUALITY PROTEIN: calpain-9 n=1 Tax=Gadus macrocephalus TaxID=80720 RepID=UPI0028CB20BE|nr:LOW QUALITY PROTEIN: calpain-9 [Gadus macrocephalus]
MSVSSEGSIPTTEDELESPIDELLGSQSRRWLSDIFGGQPPDTNGNVKPVGQDGLFIDYTFPVGQELLAKSVEWKRPMELCKSSPPQFIVDGATRMDVCQGNLGDCWFLSALASLSMHRSLLKRVVPPGQGFQNGYDGSFYFRFWQYGKWEEVRVDDLLPTQNGQLYYLRSPNRNEFWSCLLEKAYAKLKGGYQALEMGFPHEAMADMTGGVTEVLSVASFSEDLPRALQHLLRKGALVNCANCQGPLEQKNEQGILFRHAYSLTAVERVRCETSAGPVTLVRLHNPWGGTEWEGRWGDLSGPEWNTVSKDEQRRLGRVSKEDGEFWMSVSDFRRNLEIIELCHMSDSLSQPGTAGRPWHCQMHQGHWVPNLSAGGPLSLGTVWQPQFFLTLLEEDDDPSDPEKTCSFLVALMQKHLRISGVRLSIGMNVYQARGPGTPLSPQDLMGLAPVLGVAHVMRRETVLRGALAPGHYVIIPYTSLPNQEGRFILRVLTEKGNDASPAPIVSMAKCLPLQSPFPHLKALPSPNSTRQLFRKHCSKGVCKPLNLHHLLTEAIQGGVLAGSERYLALEHCKSMVVLMDSKGLAVLDWPGFKNLWYKIQSWTDVFLIHDKNGSKKLEYVEVSSAMKSAGINMDSSVMQFVGLRYTEPDMTVSYPGFLYLMMKLDSMIQKFQAFDVTGRGMISMSFKQWLHLTMFN